MKNLTLTFVAILLISGVVAAQDDNEAMHNVSIEIPSIALVDVEDADGEAQSINLSPDISVLEAGEAVDFSTATDASLWLNYTSVISGSSKRKVNAKISSGHLPKGMDLVLSVGNISTGKGETGSAVGNKIVLGNSAKDIVTQIGSCYTESGANKGHQLTYSLSVDEDEYDNFTADTYTLEILYTITD